MVAFLEMEGTFEQLHLAARSLHAVRTGMGGGVGLGY